MYSSLIWSLCALLFLLAASCRSAVNQRVSPDARDAVGGAVLESQDIRTMADSMARDLAASGILSARTGGSAVTFYVMGMQNQSSDTINREIIVADIETALLQMKGPEIAVLDRSSVGLDAVKREREAKRAGAVTSKRDRVGEVEGSDYVLYGTIRDRVQQSGRLKSAFYDVTFTLTDLETDRKVWQRNYQTKFLSNRPVTAR
ncbi:MAG: hypothetical protein U1E73_03230 [Planctomycetota bacterium]